MIRYFLYLESSKANTTGKANDTGARSAMRRLNICVLNNLISVPPGIPSSYTVAKEYQRPWNICSNPGAAQTTVT